MSEYFFGGGKGEVSSREWKRVSRIARKHDAEFTAADMPGEGPRYWFSCANRGAPFDVATANAVMAEVGSVKTKARR